MSIKFNVIVFLALVFASQVSSADGLIGAAGYAKRDQVHGGEIELGYRKSFDKFGVNIIPLSGIFYANSGSRYHSETFSNGRTVCRDSTNGQFSDADNCSSSFSFDYAAIFSGDYAISKSFVIGAGLRAGKQADPFLTARYRISDNFGFQAKAGGKYSGFGFSFGF